MNRKWIRTRLGAAYDLDSEVSAVVDPEAKP